MSLANCAGSDIPMKTLSRHADMAAYDELPAPMRRQLAEAPVHWGADGSAHLLRTYGQAVAVKTVDRVNGDIMAAYRRRVML